MPTFDFTGPDGKSYSVDGPDGSTPEQAFKILQGHLSSAPDVGRGVDALKSAAAGLGSATISTLGGLGDLTDLGAKGIGAASNYLSDKLGIDRYQPSGKSILNNIPTSESIRASVTDPIVDPDYKPQYATGEIAKRVAEFAPNAALGGGIGGVARNVVAPALGSWAGGKLTEGTAAQPYAEFAGALAGGVGASAAANKFKAMAAARTAASTTPTAEQLYKSADTGFNQARDMNVTVKPDFATNAASDMRDAIKSYDPELVKGAHGAADRLEGLATNGPVALNDMENIRKQLVSLKTSPDGSIRNAAKDAITSLQKSQMALTPADTLSGDAGAYSKLIKDATGDWAAMKRSNAVTGKMDLANLNAGTAGSGANIDNNMRQAFKQLARPMNNTNTPVWKKLGFNAQEGAAINQAATGTTVGNAARYIGKAAPTGIVSAALGAEGGHIIGGPIGAVALPVAGYIAKKIGDLSTKRAVAAVDSLVRSRSPLAAHVASQLPPQIIQQLPAKSQRLLQTLILANPTLGGAAQQQGQPVGQPNTY